MGSLFFVSPGSPHNDYCLYKYRSCPFRGSCPVYYLQSIFNYYIDYASVKKHQHELWNAYKTLIRQSSKIVQL